MTRTTTTTVSGAAARVQATLGDGFRGWLITPADDDYDTARALWNGAIDRRPALIARCTDAADVTAALRAGLEQRLPIAVRGGGHGVAGTASVDDGLVLDLSAMRAVQALSLPAASRDAIRTPHLPVGWIRTLPDSRPNASTARSKVPWRPTRSTLAAS